MTSRAIRAVLFDLDGTLVDTAPEFIHIGMRLRVEAGLSPMDSEAIRYNISEGAVGMVQAALEMPANDPDFERWRQRFLTLYESSLGDLSHPYPGLPELISRLQSADVRWGVVTNKLERFALQLMKKMPFNPAAGTVVTPDHVTQPKPDPEAVVLACQHLACDPTTAVFVGDHVRDINAGRAAGCFTIAAAYGYLGPSATVASWQADAVAHSSSELVELISALVS